MQPTALLTDFISDSILVHLQNSFAQQNRVNVCFMDAKGHFLFDPSEVIDIPAENNLFFHLLRPQKDFEKLGLEDGRFIFATFLRGRLSRVLIPIIFRETFWGAISILKLNSAFDAYMKRIFDLLRKGHEHPDHLFDPVAIHADHHLFLLAHQFLEKVIQHLEAGWGRSKIENTQENQMESFENFAIIRTTNDGNIIYVNDQALKILKFDSKDELIGSNVMKSVICQSQEIGDPEGDQEKILLECKDGSTLSAWVRVYGQNDQRGEQIGFEYHFEPVSESPEPLQLSSGNDEEFDVQALFNELEHNTPVSFEADSRLDIFHGAAEPLFVIDQHGYVQVWNSNAEQMTGIKEEDMNGHDFAEFLSPVHAEQWQEWLVRIVADKEITHFLSPDTINLNGSFRLHFFKEQILGEDYLMVKIIVSPDKNDLQETREADVLSAREMMFVTDGQGKIKNIVTPPFFASGSDTDLSGETIPHWCRVTDRQRLKSAMQKALEGQDQQLILDIKPIDQLIRCHITIKKYRDQNGLGWIFEEMSADELDVRSIEHIWTSQDTWLLEFTDEESLERELFASEHPALADKSHRKEFLNLCLAVSERHQVEIYWEGNTDRTGKMFHVMFPLVKLGKRAGVRGVVLELPHQSTDSTARYRLLNVVQAIARVSQDYEKQLLSIREITSQLSTDTELLPRQKRLIYEIHSGLESLQNFNQRLVDLDPDGSFDSRPVDLKLLINELVNTQQVLFDKDITFNVRLAEPCIVNGDFAQLYRAFDYLFQNAQQAMPDGGCIDVRIDPYDPSMRKGVETYLSGAHLVIQIRDRGKGIEPSVLGRIFEPFFSTVPDQHRGLGLAAVYSIIKRHGGYIDVSSLIGRGTTFSIYLQRAEPLQEEDKQQMSEKYTVLLVDDENDILEINGLMLKQFGYQVIKAANAKEALKKFRAYRDEIDLAIIDALLPDLPGTECAEELLSMSPHLSIIFSSGNQCSAPYQKIIDRTGGAWLQKPYGGTILNKTVKDVLDKKS